MIDDFMSEIEADPSQADLMCILQSINLLVISLKYKYKEVKEAQEELMIVEGLN